jgi:hypothetical protein
VIADVLELTGIDVSAVVTSNALSATLIGHLTIDKVGVDVGVGLNMGDDWTAFVRPTTGSSFPGVASLADWIAGGKKPADTAGGFANLKLDAHGFDLALADVTVGFNCRTRSLNYLDIKSLLTIGGLPLDLVLRIPDLTLTGTLHDAKPVKVVDMLAAFGLATTAVPGDLSITAVTFTADGKNSRYTAGMTIGDVWHAGPITLEDVSVYASYVKGAVSGTFTCTFALGASTELALSAAYEDGGWVFSGSTVPGANLEIGQVIADFGAKFGITLPDVLHTFALKQFGFSYNTATSDVSGSFTVDVTVNDTPVELTITGSRKKVEGAEQTLVTAKVAIGTSEFVGEFKDEKSQTLTLTWRDEKEPLEFADIAHAFGWHDVPSPPAGLDLALVSAGLYVDFTAKTLAVSAKSQHFGELLFATFVPAKGRNAAQRVYLFSLDVPLGVDFASLPLVGPMLPADAHLGVKDIEVIVASAALDTDDVIDLNGIISGPLGDTPLIPAVLTKGLTLAATLLIGTDSKPIVVPLTGGASPKALPAAPGAIVAAPGAALADAAPDYEAGAKWFDIGKDLGPIRFQRLGVQYQDSTLFFLLDASLEFSGLSIACQGLGLGSPLTTFAPVPHLNGLSLSFSSGPVTIDGGLLVVPPPLPEHVTEEYMGEVVIGLKPYLIAGVGAYARVSGHASVFMFAQIKGEFGGPAAFFITGFMGGFGYNSQLTLPEPDKVSAFPFIAGLDDPTIFGSDKPTPMDVLSALSGAGGKTAWVTPTTGETWIAAGLMFRSCEIVLGRALLIAAFGKELEIALLGLATMSLPQGATTDAYANVGLQLEASFKPDEGTFRIIASLTPDSFLLTKACHLTGGFAFCLWFGSNPHAGDFVVTLGGYHPAFKVPDWYPQSAPVGFNWKVGGGVTIKGGAYFALTPTAVMAGGGLEVVYESGDLRAWFIAYANMMIRWKPFYFTASIGISIGASYRLNLLFTTVTLSVEISATLDLWGPPTGGIVHIHWFIISFSVSFGADPVAPAQMKLDWAGFKSLLPNKPAAQGLLEADQAAPVVLSVDINRGLERQRDNGAWIARADELVFTTRTAIPASTLKISGTPVSVPGAPASIDIRPMQQQGVSSTHGVALVFVDDQEVKDLSKWPAPTPQVAKLPDALWGKPLSDQSSPAPSAALTEPLPTGLTFTAPPAAAGPAVGPFDPVTLVDLVGGGNMPLNPKDQADPIPAPRADANVIADIMKTLAAPDTLRAQQALVAALEDCDAAPPTDAPLTQFAARAGSLLSQAPLRAA